MASTIEIFCCYAHKDQSFLKHLRNHLTLFQKQGLINLWFDVDISPGTIWEEEIQKHLETAQIILLLISPNFMASEYCYSNEMKRALERHEQGCARVIPIVLRPVHWQLAPFGKLQALPKDAKPVKSWRDQDKAFVDVVTGILSAVEQMTIRSPKTAEINLVKPSKTPEVPLIKTSDSVLSPTLSQLSAISMSTPSSPTVSEDKQRFLALKEGEQALQYKPDRDDLSPPIVDFKDDTLPELSPVRRKTEVSKGLARSNEPTLDELDWDDLPPPIEDCEDDNQAAAQSNAGLPPLTVRQVRNAWDRIVKRVRQRSPTTAAMLKYYDIVGVEGAAGLTVIVIRAQKQGHYNYVNEQGRSKDVEWALTTEFGQNCRVRLLPPGTPLDHSV